MSATRDPRRRTTSAGSNYYYRRRLSRWDLLPAIGIGIGAGLAAFYVARLLLQRTPLAAPARARAVGKKTIVPDVRAG